MSNASTSQGQLTDQAVLWVGWQIDVTKLKTKNYIYAGYSAVSMAIPQSRPLHASVTDTTRLTNDRYYVRSPFCINPRLR